MLIVRFVLSFNGSGVMFFVFCFLICKGLGWECFLLFHFFVVCKRLGLDFSAFLFLS